MELTIYWSQHAEEKLEDIFNYYKLKAGIKTARRIVSGIVDYTIDLNKNPEIGQRAIIKKQKSGI